MIWLKNNWKQLLVLASITFILFAGFRLGESRVRKQWDAERLIQAQEQAKKDKALVEYKEKLQTATDQLVSKVAVSDSKAEIKKEIITKEVIKYVQNPNNPADVVDNDWLRIYNQSISRAD